ARASGAWAAWRPDEPAQGCVRVSASCSLVPASTPGCVERRKNRLLTSGYGIARGWNTAAKGTLRDPPVPFNGGSMLAEALEKRERCGREPPRIHSWDPPRRRNG